MHDADRRILMSGNDKYIILVIYMSFNIANRLNNLSATTTSILNDLSDNYYTKTASDSNYYTKAQTDTAIATSDANFYTKAQTDTEIANLKNKRVVIKRQRRQRSFSGE